MHGSRCVENQLDFAHLAFVHGTTIGRGYPPDLHVLTDGDGDHLRASVRGRKDGVVEFIAPRLWTLRVSDRLIQQIAFVPVDEGRTRQYVRSYQSFVTVPILADAVALLSITTNEGERRLYTLKGVLIRRRRLSGKGRLKTI